jgi:hypothetical protein
MRNADDAKKNQVKIDGYFAENSLPFETKFRPEEQLQHAVQQQIDAGEVTALNSQHELQA